MKVKASYIRVEMNISDVKWNLNTVMFTDDIVLTTENGKDLQSW